LAVAGVGLLEFPDQLEPGLADRLLLLLEEVDLDQDALVVTVLVGQPVARRAVGPGGLPELVEGRQAIFEVVERHGSPSTRNGGHFGLRLRLVEGPESREEAIDAAPGGSAAPSRPGLICWFKRSMFSAK
jgi:hypothetical protein